MTIRVLLVDDHVVVRQGLRMLLAVRNDIEVVGEASDGSDAVRQVQELKPDVVLLDLLMPGIDGIETTRQIKKLGLPCAILILTSSVQPQQIRSAIRAGAAGYVVKAIQAREMIDAVHRVASGQRALDPLAADAVVDSLAMQDELANLTPRELEVLCALARSQSNLQVAQALHISEATVRSHIANVLSKLNLRDRSHATVFALKRGLVSLDEIE